MKAINPTHQKTVNKFIKLNARYVSIVDANDVYHSEEGYLPISMMNKQGIAYSKAYEVFHDLPKRERANLPKEITLGY